ncbi:DUF1800 family protein [Shewanella sp. UCD-KL21]|uniref:DUF1800 domain-containing protein n=1 Tax=Shewanella sp. UCD-KL21 TaxID=1917164 RepID=UPI000971062A|nr:DUF1800 domain-containing protein [Shewanella sp. UCD-KL21]
MSAAAIIATNRFGLGARPNELSLATNDPKAYLVKQLVIPEFEATEFNSDEIIRQVSEFLRQEQLAKKNRQTENMMSMQGQSNSNKGNNKKKFNGPKPLPPHKQAYYQLTASAFNSAINSPNSLSWRLLQFFSNHFSVTVSGRVMTALAATLEREAIAPNLLGSFEDMLQAVSSHPAMIRYLNNEKSFGANSPLGKRGKGLNENLAREILELHTLGVNGGYTQADVIELANGISGWSIANPRKDNATGFIYRVNGHEPGARTLLGKQYPAAQDNASGVKQGQAMLADIAKQPQTATHLCYKIAKYFISDNPSESLQKKLVETWTQTDGNIKQVMLTLINAEESWQPELQKFKTPVEHVISSYRAVDQPVTNMQKLLKQLGEMGQQPFKAGSPEGFGDLEPDWNSANALMTKINWTTQFATSQRDSDTAQTINTVYGNSLSELSFNTITRAESREQALALLLLSPEFLRR